jgi:hypothetical protein
MTAESRLADRVHTVAVILAKLARKQFGIDHSTANEDL